MSSATNANSARPKEEAYLKFLNFGYKLAPSADRTITRRTGAMRQLPEPEP
jgi:hypothetical protein